MDGQKHKKKWIGPVIVAAVILALLIASGIYYYHHTIIHDGKVTDIRFTDWAYEIESTEIRDDQLVIRGWCFRETQDTQQSMPQLRIILQDTRGEAEKLYLRATYGISRPDVAAYFAEDPEGDGYPAVHDYTYCGFEASVSPDMIAADHTYEILLQQNDRDPAVVKTGVFLRDGELLQADPEWFIGPDTEGTDLADITENGYLCAYAPDSGIYIYQKDWRLYLLIDKDSIQGMQAYEYGYYDYFVLSVRNSMDEYDYIIDNRSSYYTAEEIMDTMNTGHYHVIARDIPASFPVAWIEIGIYTESGLLHYLRFFPWYDFQ